MPTRIVLRDAEGPSPYAASSPRRPADGRQPADSDDSDGPTVFGGALFPANSSSNARTVPRASRRSFAAAAAATQTGDAVPSSLSVRFGPSVIRQRLDGNAENAAGAAGATVLENRRRQRSRTPQELGSSAHRYQQYEQRQNENQRTPHLSRKDIRTSPQLPGYWFQLLACTVMLISVVQFYTDEERESILDLFRDVEETIKGALDSSDDFTEPNVTVDLDSTPDNGVADSLDEDGLFAGNATNATNTANTTNATLDDYFNDDSVFGDVDSNATANVTENVTAMPDFLYDNITDTNYTDADLFQNGTGAESTVVATIDDNDNDNDIVDNGGTEGTVSSSNNGTDSDIDANVSDNGEGRRGMQEVDTERLTEQELIEQTTVEEDPYVGDRFFNSVNGPVIRWKLIACVTIAGVGVGVFFLLLVAHYDTIFLPRLWFYMFRGGSRFEQGLLFMLCLYWCGAIFVNTTSLSVGEVQGNVFFTTWIGFVAAVVNYGTWRTSANKMSIAEKIVFHHRETTYNWTWLSAFSLAFALATTDVYYYREEVELQFRGRAVDLSRREWLFVLYVVWSLVGVCVASLLLNHFVTSSLKICGVLIGWRHIEGIVIFCMMGVYFLWIYTNTGVDGVFNGVQNAYFAVWGAFFNSVFTFGSWLRENKDIVEYLQHVRHLPTTESGAGGRR